MKFKVGDIVEFGGIEGEVVRYITYDSYVLEVEFGEYSHYFTEDGRYDISHTKPLLNLVRRPVQKLKLSAECVKIAVLKHRAMFEGDLEAILEELGFDID